MSLRIAAAVAVIALAIALAAGYLVTHSHPTGLVPAAKDPNVVAYQNQVAKDYNDFVVATSNHCNTIDDQGCAAAVAHLRPAMDKWISDLATAKTPAQYVVLAGRLRAHLTEAELELNAIVAAQLRHDETDFTLVQSILFYERAWIDPATFTLDGTYLTTVSSYHEAIKLANRSLSGCVNTTPGPDALACEHIAGAEACLGAAAQACVDDIQSAETQLQNFFIAFAQNPAPMPLAAKHREFEANLAAADDALLALASAQMTKDASKVSAAELAYISAINLADTQSEVLAT
ncbi:MAG TPA: hypothetical protein VFL29_06115 [Candidatus Dormibacteraeota bacterium]|nr:hypothetical protein [Candidatus Dormibacteraeota bacterium]